MNNEVPPDLIGGYRAFLRDHYEAEAARYRSLAEFGQAPRTLVVDCSDSRVDPSRIFNARPGELFIVRNVANLVPPCEQHGDYHGTSAALEFALEFAVRNLHVERILVLGHARCGGISAFLDRAVSAAPAQTFIEKWISLLEPAYEGELPRRLLQTGGDRQRAMAFAGVDQSLKNLATFDFVQDAIAAGNLRLHGGHFDIATGELQWLGPDRARFEPLAR